MRGRPGSLRRTLPERLERGGEERGEGRGGKRRGEERGEGGRGEQRAREGRKEGWIKH